MSFSNIQSSMEGVEFSPADAGADIEMGDIVRDPQNDIAQSEYLEKIVVGVTGREKFQKIYVRAPNGKRATEQYKPEEDAPSGQTISLLPTFEELNQRPDTIRFLVVGLVLADTPFLYSDRRTGLQRDKKRKQDRQDRGTLPAQQNILRAMVVITDGVRTGSIKYYVACHQVNGLCDMRVITSDAIFFFDEIWGDIRQDTNVKTRKPALGAACKRHASIHRPEQTIDREEGLSTVSDSPITSTLVQTAPTMVPDPLKNSSNEGTVRFFDFSSALDRSSAEKLIQEVQTSNPKVGPLSPTLIISLHDAIRENDMGGALLHKDLALFLRWGQKEANGWQQDTVVEIVREILQNIEMMNEMQ